MKLKKTIVENAKPLGLMILGLTTAGLGALAAFGGKKVKTEEYEDYDDICEESEETEKTSEEGESEDEAE